MLKVFVSKITQIGAHKYPREFPDQIEHIKKEGKEYFWFGKLFCSRRFDRRSGIIEQNNLKHDSDYFAENKFIVVLT
jgi:hypothetical protein